ncbi:MAG: hypothetical protein J0M04_24010 [Verrucomicrobia bacterium]|nr:hypothetical protein [Verrucomicrobiota bacterium]
MKPFPALFAIFAAVAFCGIFGTEYRSSSGDFVISDGRFVVKNVACPESTDDGVVLEFRRLSFAKALPLFDGGMGWGSESGWVVFAVVFFGWYIFLLIVSSLIYGDRRSTSRILMLLPKPKRNRGPSKINPNAN